MNGFMKGLYWIGSGCIAQRRLWWALPGLMLLGILLVTNNQVSQAASLNGFAEDVPAVCQTDAIAYWKLDETSGTTFEDSIGSNDGSCTNCPTAAAGRVNGAQSFTSASSTRIVVTHDNSLNVGESFTVSAWVKTSSCTGGTRVAVGKNATPSWWLGCNVSGQAVFSLRDSSSISLETTSGATLINDGQWYHLVAVREGPNATGQNRLYVNGTEVAANNQAYTGSFNNTANLMIGSHTGGFFFTGEVDEVAIYNRALTPTEIERQYQAGLLNFGYDVDNWTVADGDWTTNASWYGDAAPAATDYAVVRNNTNLTAATTAACVDVMPNAILDFGSNELTVNGAFNNDGTVRQTKTASAVSTLVEFLHVTGSAGTLYRGAEVTPTTSGLGDVTVSIRAADVANGNDCTNDSGSPPYADRCFTITAGTDGPATVRLYAANPGELNGLAVADLRPYRFTGSWAGLTTNLTAGTSGDFAYAEAETPGFSSFLLGGLQNPTAVSLHTFTAAPNLAFGLLLLSGLLLAAPTAYLLRRRR